MRVPELDRAVLAARHYYLCIGGNVQACYLLRMWFVSVNACFRSQVPHLDIRIDSTWHHNISTQLMLCLYGGAARQVSSQFRYHWNINSKTMFEGQLTFISIGIPVDNRAAMSTHQNILTCLPVHFHRCHLGVVVIECLNRFGILEVEEVRWRLIRATRYLVGVRAHRGHIDLAIRIQLR